LPTEVASYTEFYRLFAQTVRRGTALPVTVGAAVNVMRLIALAQESAHTGQRLATRAGAVEEITAGPRR
jgi:predicted dehydrogenase